MAADRIPPAALTSDASIAERVDALIATMSTAEKAGQLTQYFHFGPLVHAGPDQGESDSPPPPTAEVEPAIARGEAGSLLFVKDPAEINRLQRLAIEGSRLGIPLLFAFDVIHGLRTILPVPIAMAASWDPVLVEKAQAVAAREARAVGICWTFAPMVDIARDPRWGRIVEGAGEDPFLGCAMAAAQVRGLQGAGPGTQGGVIAGPKHLAGYGASLGGRDYDEVNLSDSELWNVYLPPFKAAVEAGARNVMTAYMPLNGIPAAGNDWLVDDVLRGAWGFGGFVVSDANAVRSLVTQNFAADLADAGARAVEAGVDIEMALADAAYARLPEAVASGRLSEDQLDTCVRRVLEAKFAMGLFERPYVDLDEARRVLADPTHRDVARIAAERAAVLLRNDEGLLPLDAGRLTSIAVIGPLAASGRDPLGPWCFDHDPDETVTIVAGIREKIGAAVDVRYAPGIRPAKRLTPSIFDMVPGNIADDPEDFDDDAELARAAELARESDVAVVVVGEWQNMIGEQASRSSLELPGRQAELLRAVVATGTPVVLLVMNGRPLDLCWASEHVSAILDIWYPGTSAGSAVANLLFGDASPAGKLPFTWPRHAGQVPMIYAYTRSHAPADQMARYIDGSGAPLFSFGHGLSYATFEYGDLVVEPPTVGLDDDVAVTVTLTNTSRRTADEVAQLYLHQRHGSASRPVRELKGFQRVSVAAGESVQLSFTLGPTERRYWNAAARDWVLDPSVFDVWVGTDSTAQLSATFEVRER